MLKKPAAGFIGFGEAGSNIAKGLRASELDWTFAFDIMRTLLSILLLAAVTASLYAQQQAPATDHHAVTSPQPRPGAPSLMDGMGRVDFAITTKSKEAQAFFNQGVAQLYGFWFDDAERSLLQAAKLDPDAAMAYWGIAMAAAGDFLPTYQLFLIPGRTLPVVPVPNSPESRARDAIVKAQALRSSVTPRERLYIDAVALRHNPRLRDPDAAYIDAMRRLVASFPDDLDAKSILGLALATGYDATTKSPREGTGESLELLRQVLTKDPNHVGANHFWIHGLEGSKNIGEALPVAERYAALAPNIPHVLHMPGHVYAATGRFDEAVKAFLAAAAKEREYISADPLYSKQHYLHNEIFLLYVLGSQGRYRDAMSRIADLLPAIKNPADREAADFYSVGRFGLIRTLVRFEKWDEILDGQTLPVDDRPFESTWYHWARGLAYASNSNAADARDSLRLMEQSIQSLKRIMNPIPHQLLVARSELEAYIEAKTGDVKRGLDALNRSATSEFELLYTDPPVYPRPVLELLGRTALNARDFQTAESAYRRALVNEPGGGRALWGLAKALEGLGKKDEAEKALMEFNQMWRGDELR